MNDIRVLWKESIAKALTSMLPEGTDAVTAERMYTKPTLSTTAAYISVSRCLHISSLETVSIP